MLSWVFGEVRNKKKKQKEEKRSPFISNKQADKSTSLRENLKKILHIHFFSHDPNLEAAFMA